MPRMTRHLAHTPFDRIQALALAAVAQAVMDDNAEFIVGADEKWLDDLLGACGMGEVAIWRFKVMFCLGLIDRRAFDSRTLNAVRRYDAPEEPVFWDSWKRLPQ